jgi:hypothetical protein
MDAAIGHLVDAVDRYLEGLSGEGIADVRAGIERARGHSINAGVANIPACGCLDDALAAISNADGLAHAIAAARPHLRWTTYDVYDATIGRRFPSGHAFASLIGGGAPIAARDFDLGLFLIAPRMLYRDHHHAAPELYAPLTGPHRWRFGIGEPWIERPAHQPVWNQPWDVHATITGEVPFLCIFCWTRDVNALAKTVFSGDWDVIEAAL